MALIQLPVINPQEMMRQPYTFFNGVSVTSTTTTDAFQVKNMSGCVIWFKAVSSAGTPNITLSVETSKDDVTGNYLSVTPPCSTSLPVTIADENVHVFTINFNQMHDYGRFKLTLNGGDGGDDVVTMVAAFLYGGLTHPTDVVLEAGDLEIGAVEIKNATTDDRASVDASGRLLTRITDTSGTSITVGQKTMAASVPVTLASDQTAVVVDTEFPAAAALTDNFANPTTTSVAGMNMLWDGATWDRAPGDSTNGIKTQPAAGGTGVDGATVARVTLATNVALPAGTNAIGKLAANSGVDIGDVDVTSIIPGTGATNLGKAQDSAVGSTDTNVGIMAKRVDTLATITPANGDYALAQLDSSGRLYVNNTSGPQPTLFTNFGANATLNVKASAGTVFAIVCNNRNVSERFIQIHNTTTTPAGGATPILTFSVPGSTTVGIGTDILTAHGVAFSTGIAFGFSTTQSTYTAGTASDQFTTILYS